eukprot:COSAG01_NODE_1852_length_9061_cov_50.987949_5_plen_249_part_00
MNNVSFPAVNSIAFPAVSSTSVPAVSSISVPAVSSLHHFISIIQHFRLTDQHFSLTMSTLSFATGTEHTWCAQTAASNNTGRKPEQKYPATLVGDQVKIMPSSNRHRAHVVCADCRKQQHWSETRTKIPSNIGRGPSKNNAHSNRHRAHVVCTVCRKQTTLVEPETVSTLQLNAQFSMTYSSLRLSMSALKLGVFRMTVIIFVLIIAAVHFRDNNESNFQLFQMRLLQIRHQLTSTPTTVRYLSVTVQ